MENVKKRVLKVCQLGLNFGGCSSYFPFFLTWWNARNPGPVSHGIVPHSWYVLQPLSAASFQISLPLAPSCCLSAPFVSASILSTCTFWRTMIPICPIFLVYALLLPSYNSPVWGSPLGISISLCDPGPCAATAICKVGPSCHVVNAKPCSKNKKEYDETTAPCYHVWMT